MTYAFVALILLGSFFLPWWWLTVAGIAFGYRFGGKTRKSQLVFASIVSGSMVWGVFAYYYNAMASGLIASRMGEVFGLPSSWMFTLLTAIFGALLALGGTLLGDEIRLYRRRKLTLQDLDRTLHNT